MNKKILILIMCLPLVLMFVIFSVVQTASINAPIMVSGIKVNNGYNGIEFRYLDEWEDIKIQYSIYPVNAANKGVTFSVEDNQKDLITISKDGLINQIKKPGTYKITVKTNDGGYSDSFIINALYKNPVIEDLDLKVTEIKSINAIVYNPETDTEEVEEKNYLLYGESVKIYANVNPVDALVKKYRVRVEDESVVKAVCNSITGEITIKGTGQGNTKIYIYCEDEVNNIVLTKEIDLNIFLEAELPIVSKVVGIDAIDFKESYFQNEQVQDFDLMVIYDDDTAKTIKSTDPEVKILKDDVVTPLDTKNVGSFSYTISYHGISIEVLYEVKKIEVIDMDLVFNPDINAQNKLKTDYKMNETLGITAVKLTYNNGDEKIVPINDTNLILDGQFSTNNFGTQNVKLSYENYNEIYSYNVVEKKVSEFKLINHVFDEFRLNDSIELTINATFTSSLYTDEQATLVFSANQGNYDEVTDKYKYQTSFYNYEYEYKIINKEVNEYNFVGIKDTYKFGEIIGTINLQVKYTNSRLYPNETFNINTLSTNHDFEGFTTVFDNEFTIPEIPNYEFAISYRIVKPKISSNVADKYRHNEINDCDLIIDFSNYFTSETLNINLNTTLPNNINEETKKIEGSINGTTYNFEYKVVRKVIIERTIYGLPTTFNLNYKPMILTDYTNLLLITVYNDPDLYENEVINLPNDGYDVSPINYEEGLQNIVITYQNNQYTKQINMILEELVVKNITINNSLSTLRYKINDSLNISIDVSYTNSNFTDTIKVNESMVNDYQIITSTAGVKHIVVNYHNKSVNIDINVVEKIPVLSDVIITGLSSKYYQNSINEITIKWVIPFNDAIYQNETGSKTFTLNTSILGINKVNNIIPYNIEFSYLIFKVDNITIDGLKNNDIFRHDYTGLNKDSIVTITYSDNTTFKTNINNYLPDYVFPNQTGDYQIIINDYSYSETFKYKVVEKAIKNAQIFSDLDWIFYKNEKINIINTYVIIEFTSDLYSNERINVLSTSIDTSTLGEKQLKVTYNNQVIITKNYVVNAPIAIELVLKTILKDKYLLNEIIDTSTIIFSVIYEDDSVVQKSLNEIDNSIVLATDEIGNKNIDITYDKGSYKISYEVYELQIKFVNFASVVSAFYINEPLDKIYLKIYYSDNSNETIYYGDERLTFENLTTEVIGTRTMRVLFKGQTFTNEYTVYNIINCNNLSYLTETGIVNNASVSISTNLIGSNYTLKYQSTTCLVELIKNNNNYNINITLNEGLTKGEVKLYVEGYEKASITLDVTLASDWREIVDFDLTGVDYIKMGKANNVFEIIQKNENVITGLTYEWHITKGNDLITYHVNDTLFVVEDAKAIGVVEIEVTIKKGILSTVFKFSFEILNPSVGIIFVDSSKTYGIEGTFAIGKYLSNGEKTAHSFDVISGTNHINDGLIYIVSDETVARFNGNQLEVLLNEKAQKITIYAIVEDAVKLGYIKLNEIDWSNPDEVIISDATQKYVTKMELNCTAGTEITTSEELTNAVRAKKEIVIMNDINIGPDIIDLGITESNGTISYNPTLKTTSSDAIEQVNNFLSQMATTADWDFYKNGATKMKFSPQINYCLKFGNNVYGNGYTLDAFNITALSTLATGDISNLRWNGPLDLVNLLGISVKSQDNIAFIIDDGVTVDNIILQGCHDFFMKKGEYNDLTLLNNVGTVVEVMGDNVNIINSRIKNGRNCLRVFGDDRPYTEYEVPKMNVKVESCIISNAREFLVRVGTNRDIKANPNVILDGVPYKVSKLYERGNNISILAKDLDNNERERLFEESSPYLEKQNGENYIPGNNYLTDEYFMNNLVKTELTLKNVILINSGLFAIGVETKFAGPTLAGFRYNDYAGADWSGWYEVGGTSYPAVINLVDEVQIYDWKNIKNVDSSSLIQHGANVSEVFKNLKFDIGKMMTNMKDNENYHNLVSEVDGEYYVHSGIAFFGGGKNYSILNTNNINTGESVFTTEGLKEYRIPINAIDLNSDKFNNILPWASGKEDFRFMLYDTSSEFNYLYQKRKLSDGSAFNWLKPAEQN